MGKRSNFERIPRDYYPTPAAAVVPLVPYLRAGGIRTFSEPCAGAGDLIRHLESFGLHCTYAGDISSGQDALDRNDYGACDMICTNPPHSRPLMHALITHFQSIAPTWLLIDHDWLATKQAVPFLAACTDIAPIGRVKWFADSKYSSKDNYSWLRFCAGHSGGPIFHGRGGETLPALLDGATP